MGLLVPIVAVAASLLSLTPVHAGSGPQPDVRARWVYGQDRGPLVGNNVYTTFATSPQIFHQSRNAKTVFLFSVQNDGQVAFRFRALWYVAHKSREFGVHLYPGTKDITAKTKAVGGYRLPSLKPGKTLTIKAVITECCGQPPQAYVDAQLTVTTRSCEDCTPPRDVFRVTVGALN